MKLQPLMFGSRMVVAISIPPRQVQLPARAFQLLARRSYDSPTSHSHRTQKAHLHTTTQRQQHEQHGAHQTANSPPTQPITHNQPITQQPTSDRSEPPINQAPTIKKPVHEKPRKSYTVRQYMRHVTHPVAIITSADSSIDAQGGPTTWRGATVSSFNSVTLDPEPYVSFNIKKLSSTYDAIRNSNLFLVHLMSNTPEAAELATHFSRGNNASPFYKKPPLNNTDNQPPTLHPFISTYKPWTSLIPKGSTLPPSIWWHYKNHTRAVIFQFLCEFQKDQVAEVGDHVIVVGKVLAQSGPMDDDQELERHRSPVPTESLTYVNGKYSRADRSRFLVLAPRNEAEKVEDKAVSRSVDEGEGEGVAAPTELKIRRPENLVIRRYGAAPKGTRRPRDHQRAE